MNDGRNEVSRRRGYRRPGREGGHGLIKAPLRRCRPLSPARMEVLTQAVRRMLGSGVSPIKQMGTEAWDGREGGSWAGGDPPSLLMDLTTQETESFLFHLR